MVGAGGGLIVNVTVFVPVPFALVPLRTTFVAPVAVGVPEIKPVPALTVKPAGSGLAAQVVMAWFAVIW